MSRPDREPPSWPRQVGRCWSVVLGAVVLLAAERLLAPEDVQPPGELRLVLAQWGLHAIVLAGWGEASLVAAAGFRRLRGDAPGVLHWGWLVVGVAAAAAALAAVPVGSELGGGAWISQQRFAWAVRAAPPAAAALAVCALCVLGIVVADSGSRWVPRGLVTAAFAAGFVVLAVANHTVLTAQYDGFHLMAYLLSAGALLPAVDRAIAPLLDRLHASRGGPRASIAVGVTGVVALCAAVAAGSLVSRRDVRADLVQHTEVGNTLVRDIGADEQLDFVRAELDALSRGVAGGRGARPPRGLMNARSPGGKPWNVILLVVDALRADTTPPSRDFRPRQTALDASYTPFINTWSGGTFRFSHVRAQASATHRSMPALFRSLDCNETGPDVDTGVSLPDWSRQAGLSPVAMVSDYFAEPRFQVSHQLLDGFDRVDVYANDDIGKFADMAKAFLGEVDDRPFLAWLHYYGLHDPYFDGDKFLGKEDGARRDNYGRALRYFDGVLQRFMAQLRASPIGEHTIVILASDHGEALGAHRVGTHSMTCFEEEVLVPLYFDVPGQRGRRVDAPVGNIDILPTLGDILGVPSSPLHRGESLVPLMMGRAVERDPVYYCENGYRTKRIASVVHGDDKLIYNWKGNIFFRFDLERDPRERDNLFTPEGNRDRQLLRTMLRRNPEIFERDLAKPETREALREVMAGVDIDDRGRDVEALLRIAARVADPGVIAQTRRFFEEASDVDRRAAALQTLAKLDPRAAGAALRSRLRTLQDTPAELDLIAALARRGQAKLIPEVIGARMLAWAGRGTPEQLEPYLRLTLRWQDKRVRHFGEALATMILRLPADDPAAVPILNMALENFADLSSRYPNPEVAAKLAGLLDHSSLHVQRFAAWALGVCGDRSVVPVLRRRLRHPNMLIRQSAMRGYGGIAGTDATDDLARVAKRGGPLVMDAVHLLEAIGDRRAARGLGEIEDAIEFVHYKRAARVARIRVERRLAAGAKRPGGRGH